MTVLHKNLLEYNRQSAYLSNINIISEFILPVFVFSDRSGITHTEVRNVELYRKLSG